MVHLVLKHIQLASKWYTCYWNDVLLPVATKLGQGNIFTSMCQEFCPQGGRVSASVHAGIPPRSRHQYHPRGADTPQSRHPPEQTPPRADTPPEADTPREADCSRRSTSGRYASYWNAFLFCYIFMVNSATTPINVLSGYEH